VTVGRLAHHGKLLLTMQLMNGANDLQHVCKPELGDPL